MVDPDTRAHGSTWIQVRCPPRTGLLGPLRRLVAEMAGRAGLDGEGAAQVEMAVDEALTNAIEHPANEGEGMIEMELALAEGCLTVRIENAGRPGGAPASMIGEPTVDAYCRPGRDRYKGLGLLVMRRFMDEVRIEERPQGGTRVILQKRLAPPAAAEKAPAP